MPVLLVLSWHCCWKSLGQSLITLLHLIVTPREMLAGTWAPVPWPSWMGVGHTWGILWLGHFVMSTTNENKGTCCEKVVIMILRKYNRSFLVHIRSKLTWAMPSSFLFVATTAMPYYFNIFDEHRITFTWESPSPSRVAPQPTAYNVPVLINVHTFTLAPLNTWPWLNLAEYL